MLYPLSYVRVKEHYTFGRRFSHGDLVVVDCTLGGNRSNAVTPALRLIATVPVTEPATVVAMGLWPDGNVYLATADGGAGGAIVRLVN